jgi:hypothetical protein
MEGDVGTSQLTPDTGVSPPERPGSEAPRSPGLRFTSRSVGAQRNRATDLHVDPPAFRYDRSGVPTSHRGTSVQVGTRDVVTAQTQRAVEHFRL